MILIFTGQHLLYEIHLQFPCLRILQNYKQGIEGWVKDGYIDTINQKARCIVKTSDFCLSIHASRDAFIHQSTEEAQSDSEAVIQMTMR